MMMLLAGSLIIDTKKVKIPPDEAENAQDEKETAENNTPAQ
jgi:hypothetical protein